MRVFLEIVLCAVFYVSGWLCGGSHAYRELAKIMNGSSRRINEN